MEIVLLVGTAPAGVVEAALLRGLRLVGSGGAAATACRVALIAGAPGDALPTGLPPHLRLLVVAGDEAALVSALDAGADDAVAAHASAAQIAARLAALLRRPAPPAIERFGSLTIDRLERRVTRGGRDLALLPREYAVLLQLVRHAGTVVSRAMLRAAVWGSDFDPGTNVIEVHVSRLRGKLDRDFAVPMLRTEKGRGYRLVTDRDTDSSIAAAAERG